MPHSRKIKLEYYKHRGQVVVLLTFDYDAEVINLIKKFNAVSWSRSLNCWYIPRNKFELRSFLNMLKKIALIDYSALKGYKGNKSGDSKEIACSYKN